MPTMLRNYPKPFNPMIEISFSLPQPSHVRLEIFNVMCQKIAILVDGHHDLGIHTVV